MQELIQVCLLGFIFGYVWHHRLILFKTQQQLMRDMISMFQITEESDDSIKQRYVNGEITEEEMEQLLEDELTGDVPMRLENIENKHAAVKTIDGVMYMGYKYKKRGDYYVLYE